MWDTYNATRLTFLKESIETRSATELSFKAASWLKYFQVFFFFNQADSSKKSWFWQHSVGTPEIKPVPHAVGVSGPQSYRVLTREALLFFFFFSIFLNSEESRFEDACFSLLHYKIFVPQLRD